MAFCTSRASGTKAGTCTARNGRGRLRNLLCAWRADVQGLGGREDVEGESSQDGGPAEAGTAGAR